MKKIKKEIKGITLVALVVTIIVLLILAGIAINLSIGNNGLFTRAENAGNAWRRAETNEAEEMNRFENTYDGTLRNLGLEGGNEVSTKTPITEITGDETTNTEVVDKNGDRAFIPAGFIVDSENNTVADGLVVIDKKGGNADTVGNEFVWVPCTLDGDNNTLKYDRYAFTRETPTWNYRQSLVLGANGEYEKDRDGSYKIRDQYDIDNNRGYYYHEAMPEIERLSIKKYGGYYIGRYEVGTDSERSTNSKGNITAIGRVKASLPVYNWVTRNEAITIAERMYAGKSKLCSSYAWDTALKFIDGESGTYAVNSIGDNNKTTSSNSKLENTGYHEEKNIYDMGGNIMEWTTEAYTFESYPCVGRRWQL